MRIALRNVPDLDAVPNGAIIVAHMADIEGRGPMEGVDPRCFELPWSRKWDDGVYHYTALVARNGVRDTVDANGDVCGVEAV